MRFHLSSLPACKVIVGALILLTGCSSSDRTGDLESDSQSTVQESELQILELGEQARKNLNLVVKPARPTDFWKTISIPGVVSDRPGISDRGVTSPAVGVISEIHAYPGDTVRPGQPLVTLKLFSEYLQATQTQLFKATQELTLLQQQIDRLSGAANAGAVSGARLIELRNEFERQQTLAQTSRQELLNRGLHPEQIVSITSGSFVTEIDVLAPQPLGHQAVLDGLVRPEAQLAGYHAGADIAYELQSLGVELGQTVQAGELIAKLANHQSLYVVGHAFKREAGRLELATEARTPLQVEFAEDSAELWPPLQQQFVIRHIANTIDTNTRTFDFFVPLQNQARTYLENGQTFLVWRFRPGQRTRIEVPVEKFSDVYVLPSEAVVREGPEAYVYRQNGDLFNQMAVHVVYEDRSNVVIANDRTIVPGTYLAQNAAASLRRVLKAQSASGAQLGLHVHADGSVHAGH